MNNIETSWREIAADEHGRCAELEVNGVIQCMRWIAPGRFLMGSPEGESGRDDDEGPQHEVIIKEGFWLGDTPCTQALWEAVMGSNPSDFEGRRRPVESVSAADAEGFIKRLSTQASGPEFRLPFEAEWEYACRAGTRGATYAEVGASLADIAWYGISGDRGTKDVAQLRANGWGLYDMLGNVWEWCADERRRYAVSARPIAAPRVPAWGSTRAVRGGSWDESARDVRAACRFANRPGKADSGLGFRLVRSEKSRPLAIIAPNAPPKPNPPRAGRAPSSAHWAHKVGTDEYGDWAELKVPHAIQRMRWVAPGRFLMGSSDDEPGRQDREGPQHEVIIEEGFWLGDTPCTQALWEAVMGSNPSEFQGPQRPIESVSVADAERFLKQLSSQSSGPAFRLPFEAEWEYACRAGTSGASYAEAGGSLGNIAWYGEHGGRRTKDVAQLWANGWGLYDMLGNMWEWCADEQRRYAASAMPIAAPRVLARDTASPVARGGSWGNPARFVRCACRNRFGAGLRSGGVGVRLVRDQ